MAADIIQSTTQQFLDIHDIANNFVIMKDGTVSIVITVDAMNFGLLAEEEQDAVMYAYAGLLNSLNYTIQIVINSQTKDVTAYLSLLKDQENTATNETIRKRIRAYREFVGNLIHDRNVLDKKFYVVIPANAIELSIVGAKSVLPGQSKFDITSVERSVLLERAANILDPRRDHLIAQFARIGLYSRQLTTQEIIQLFYIRYNPEATEGQQIAESSSYTSPLVQASIQGNFMNDSTQNATPAAQDPATDVTTQTPPMATPATPAMPEAPTADTTSPSDSPIESMPNILSNQPATGATPATSSTPPMSSPATTEPETAQPAPTGMTTPPAMTEAPETPATPAVSPSAPTPSVAPSSPEPTPAMPSAAGSTPSSATSSAEEAKIQADLNATIQQMGGAASAPTEPATGATPAAPETATTPDDTQAGDTKKADAATGGDLPPLPEI